MFASVISRLGAALRRASAHARAFALLEDAPITRPARPSLGAAAGPSPGCTVGNADGRRAARSNGPSSLTAAACGGRAAGGRRAGAVAAGVQPCQVALAPRPAARDPHAEAAEPEWRTRVRA